MRSKENAIITVAVGDRKIDMELPLFIDIEKLKSKLKETLDGLGIMVNNFNLSLDDGTLINDFCLSHYGVWEGSVIKVV